MVKSKKSKTGDIVIVVVSILFIAICLLPLINIAARSLSSTQALINSRVSFFPVEFNLDSYYYILHDAAFLRSLWWTVILTVICTLVSLFMTILCSYPLIFDVLKGKRFLNGVMLLTMYFSAGTIPNYLLMKQLGWIDKPIVLVVPGCLSIFNMIILRSFLYGVPDSLRESAELDGAGPIMILRKIYLPLSKPVLATLTLFYAVGRWNGFSDALMYVTDQKWHPIQLKLYNLINNVNSIDIAIQEGFTSPQASEGLKAASVLVATIPIVIVYPFLQRYFISGATLGAVKE